MNGRSVAAGVIFVGSYLALAIGRIPGLSIDRAGIALAVLASWSHRAPFRLRMPTRRWTSITTTTLLLGMMIVVASLRLSGFFAVATAWVRAHARSPAGPARRGRHDLRLLFRLPSERCDLPGAGPARSRVDARARAPARALSAGRGNGVECRVDRDHHRQPAEHDDRQLLAYHLHQIHPSVGAGRCGRAAIAVALIASSIAPTVLARLDAPATRDERQSRAGDCAALLATLILIVLFFAGAACRPKAAIIIGALSAADSTGEERRVYAEIDWSLLLMFAGLFIIVAGAERDASHS